MRGLTWLTLVCACSCAAASAQENAALPEGAVARLGVYRLRARSVFDQACAITPDGRTIVTVDRTGDDPNQRDIVLYDIATGLETGRLGIKNARYFVMANDVPRVLLYTGAGFELWDVAKKQRLASWPRRLVNIDFVRMAISPDGTQFVASVDNWNTLRWNEDSLVMPELMQKYSWSHAFSADGSQFYCIRIQGGRNCEILVYDAKTNRQTAQWKYKDGYVAVSPCGKKVARGSHDEPMVVGGFDPSRMPDVVIPVRATTPVFSRDGKRLLIYEYDGAPTRVWDIAKNKAVASLPGVGRYAIPTPDWRYLVSTASGIERPMRMSNEQLHVWDVASGKRVRFKGGHPYHVGGLVWSPDGKRIASFSHDTILMFDAASGRELRQWIAEPGSAITQIGFSPDGQLLASASAHGSIALWNPDTGEARKRIDLVPKWASLDKDDTLARSAGIAKGNALAIAFARDGKTLTACVGRSLVTFDVAQGTLVRNQRFIDAQFSPRLAPCGRYFASAQTFPHDPFVLSFAAAPVAYPRVPLAAAKTNQAYAFSPDGALLATSNVEVDPPPPAGAKNIHHSVRVWETKTRSEIVRFTGLPSCPLHVAISPDNRTLVHCVAASTSALARPGGALLFRDLSSAQGLSLGLQASDEDARQRWLRGQNVLPLADHPGDLICLSFSPDSKRIATGGMGGVIDVWDVARFHKPAAPAARQESLDKLWRDLADADAGKAYRAIARMESTPDETVAYLRQRLRPAKAANEKAIRQHLSDLASDRFVVRQQATAALEKAADEALPFVRRELALPIPLETKRRLEALLEKLEDIFESGEHLRAFRALTLLRRIGTPEARRLIEELSRGAPGAWLTDEATFALPAP